MGTLTLSNSDSIHTSIFLIALQKLYTMVTPKYSVPSYLENYAYIVVFVPILWRAFFNRIMRSLQHSTTIKLMLLSELIKGLYLTLRVL
jgi:hypothetical protein